MNRNFVMTINIAVSGADFFACSISTPKIVYYGLRFDK